MDDYVTTNVRLPREQLKTLKLKAIEENKSMGEVLRQVLTRGLEMKASPKKEAPKNKISSDNPFAAIIGLGSSKETTNDARDHDEFLYGLPKKAWKK